MTVTQNPVKRTPDAITGKSRYVVTTPTRTNAKTWARTFEARILEPGIVSYEDVGCGKAFLTKESIEASMHTFIGKPLVLTKTLKHRRMTPSDLEQHAKGYISDWFYGPDGWFWVKGIVHDDAAKEAINTVGLCSCAYDVPPGGVGPGREYHAIPFDEEILSFSGEHLAIVDDPRYEGATIRLNSKTKYKMKLKFWEKPASKQNATEAKPAADTTASDKTKDNAKGDVADITGETVLTIPTLQNGKTEEVTVEDLVTCWNSRNGIELDREVEIDGQPVKLSAAVDAFKKLNAKEDDEEKKENASEDDEDKKENASEDDDKEDKTKEQKKKNSRVGHFNVLLNARAAGSINEGPQTGPDDMASKIQRGNQRYGSVTLTGKN